MSKQQAALAHSWLSWLCLTPVTGQVLPPDRSAAFPQAASKVVSAHVAPAQGSCNKSPCRELPSARCPAVTGCPLMEAHPAPRAPSAAQQQGWALPALGTGRGPPMSPECPALQRAWSKRRVTFLAFPLQELLLS